MKAKQIPYGKYSIIEELVNLEFNFSTYMKNGESLEEVGKPITALEKSPSGNELLKKYRIGLYEDICEKIISNPEIEVTRIEQMIEEWAKEKAKYSTFEIEYVDRKIIAAVIAEQIKGVNKNEELNTGLAAKLNEKIYNSMLIDITKRALLEKERDGLERIRLENFLNNLNPSEVTNNRKIWEILLKYKSKFSKEKIEQILSDKIEETKQESYTLSKGKPLKKFLVGVKAPKLTFLTKEQLNDINWRIETCKASDFAKALGIWDDKRYMTKTLTKFKQHTSDDIIDYYKLITFPPTISGYDDTTEYNKRIAGIRPAIHLSSLNEIPMNGNNVKRIEDGVLEVEYGYYPQEAAPLDVQLRIEQEFLNERLNKTGNTYTTDLNREPDTFSREEIKPFEPKSYEEYEFEGKRYIRVEADFFSSKYERTRLTNGERYKNGNPIWIEVQPVKWLVDEKEKIMITEKILVSGIQYDRRDEYKHIEFRNSDVKRFLDRYLAKELVQNIPILSKEGQAKAVEEEEHSKDERE